VRAEGTAEEKEEYRGTQKRVASRADGKEGPRDGQEKGNRSGEAAVRKGKKRGRSRLGGLQEGGAGGGLREVGKGHVAPTSPCHWVREACGEAGEGGGPDGGPPVPGRGGGAAACGVDIGDGEGGGGRARGGAVHRSLSTGTGTLRTLSEPHGLATGPLLAGALGALPVAELLLTLLSLLLQAGEGDLLVHQRGAPATKAQSGDVLAAGPAPLALSPPRRHAPQVARLCHLLPCQYLKSKGIDPSAEEHELPQKDLSVTILLQPGEALAALLPIRPELRSQTMEILGEIPGHGRQWRLRLEKK